MYASSLLIALIPLASAYITGDIVTAQEEATVTETDCTTSVSEAVSSQVPVPTIPVESVSTAVDSAVATKPAVPALSTAPAVASVPVAAASGAVTYKSSLPKTTPIASKFVSNQDY
ncbi:unnamed protein product [Ambrosiozyma monospora]|uniref:Unnamed protein product n=1 Tax=Ambrosiozyma monospora TaxID=43982 RepID=A0ACB5TKU5_AMBMO|nr:unnamed protein product [Ambrosiozyma monospora]